MMLLIFIFWCGLCLGPLFWGLIGRLIGWGED
jgi:hypothetical protein